MGNLNSNIKAAEANSDGTTTERRAIGYLGLDMDHQVHAQGGQAGLI
jgi:hypothetical protein